MPGLFKRAKRCWAECAQGLLGVSVLALGQHSWPALTHLRAGCGLSSDQEHGDPTCALSVGTSRV